MTPTGIKKTSISSHSVSKDDARERNTPSIKKKNPLPRMLILGEAHGSPFSSAVIRKLVYRLLKENKKVFLYRESDAEEHNSFEHLKDKMRDLDDIENFMTSLTKGYLRKIIKEDISPTNKEICDAFYSLGETIQKEDNAFYELFINVPSYALSDELEEYLGKRSRLQRNEFYRAISNCLKNNFSTLFKDEYLTLPESSESKDFEKYLFKALNKFIEELHIAYAVIDHEKFDYAPIDLARDSMKQIEYKLSDDLKQVASFQINGCDKIHSIEFYNEDKELIPDKVSERLSLVLTCSDEDLSREKVEQKLELLKNLSNKEMLAPQLRDLGMLHEVNKKRLEAQSNNTDDNIIFIMVVGDLHRKNIQENYKSTKDNIVPYAYNATIYDNNHNETHKKKADKIVDEVIIQTGVLTGETQKDHRNLELFPSSHYKMLEVIISLYQQEVEENFRKEFPDATHTALMRRLYTLTPNDTGQTGL